MRFIIVLLLKKTAIYKLLLMWDLRQLLSLPRMQTTTYLVQ